MPSSFLTRSIDLLDPEGGIAPTGLTEVALSQPSILVARERCRFELFRAPPGLGASAALAAARLHAEARAPYDQPGTCLTRQGDLFGMWWWDQGWAAERLASAGAPLDARLLPEAMAQPEADGWRILRGASGYEAQSWNNGFLTASSWRRRPFDQQSWSAFARQRQDSLAPAPETPPPAQSLPYTWRSLYRRRLVTARSAEGILPLAVSVTALLLVGVTALLIGQGLKMKQEDARVKRELAFEQSRPHFSQRPRLTAESQRLQALQAAAGRPDPILLVGQAQRILQPFHLKVTSFEATADEITVTVPAEAVAGIDILTEELQASPYFTNIRPTLDRGKKQLILRMTVKGSERFKARKSQGLGAAPGGSTVILP
jgi:hypothetical protein